MTFKLHPLNILRKLTGLGCVYLYLSLYPPPHTHQHNTHLPSTHLIDSILDRWQVFYLYDFLVRSGWREMIISSKVSLRCRDVITFVYS